MSNLVMFCDTFCCESKSMSLTSESLSDLFCSFLSKSSSYVSFNIEETISCDSFWIINEFVESLASVSGI